MQHPSRHVWDFWYYFDAANHLFHIFYLNADRDLVASDQHHFASCVGHATTADFDHIDWGKADSCHVLKPALGHWANTCIWSGDVIQVQNGYLMFFTSRDRHRDDGFTQSIGVAYTDDVGSPHWQILDTQIRPGSVYHTRSIDGDLTFHAWRDPFLFRQQDGQIYMLLSAKTGDGHLGRSGAIALLSVSESDFSAAVQGHREWEYLSPAVQPRCYAEMEVPQLYKNPQGGYELVFSTWAKYDFAPTTEGAGGFQGLTLPRSGDTEAAIEFSSTNPNFRVLLPEKYGLYACRIVPELDGEIIGFDIQMGGIRRSGIKTRLAAMDRDFSDFSV
ncbi:beta-fructosidase [Leptolyngbya sp. KIOST-1]|uniref:beta-fructosidase n=1 Tax=Leptolyngbya sp. KIOST-1 TaxID=1229172 RepID=UPI000A897BE8|nr:beta-fructosidase [Leptolyngbya sp. KIOST-1]